MNLSLLRHDWRRKKSPILWFFRVHFVPDEKKQVENMCTIIPCVLYVWVRSYKGLIPPLFLTLSEVLFLLSLEQSVHARFTMLCSSWNVHSMGWSLYLLACTFLKRYLGKGASWEFHIHDCLPSLFQFSVSSWKNHFTYACPSLGYGLGQNFLWGKKFHGQLLIA